MPRITLKMVTVKITTGIDGDANFSLKVPGTFNGVTDNCNGRFLRGVSAWTDGGSNGDRIENLRLEDTDLILQGIGASSQFPDYPVLHYFTDQEVVETANMKAGFYFPSDGMLQIQKIDPREPFDFIPSGMYLKGTFVTGNAVLLGQVMRANIIWGKNS